MDQALFDRASELLAEREPPEPPRPPRRHRSPVLQRAAMSYTSINPAHRAGSLFH